DLCFVVQSDLVRTSHVANPRKRALAGCGLFRLRCCLVAVDVPQPRAKLKGHSRGPPECDLRGLRALPLCQEPNVHRRFDGWAEPWPRAGNMAGPGFGR